MLISLVPWCSVMEVPCLSLMGTRLPFKMATSLGEQENFQVTGKIQKIIMKTVGFNKQQKLFDMIFCTNWSICSVIKSFNCVILFSVTYLSFLLVDLFHNNVHNFYRKSLSLLFCLKSLRMDMAVLFGKDIHVKLHIVVQTCPIVWVNLVITGSCNGILPSQHQAISVAAIDFPQ